jgi:hypothetical protein
VRIEVLNQTREEMSLVVGESVCQLVLDWVKRQCEDDAINLDQLTEKVCLKYARLINISVLTAFAPFLKFGCSKCNKFMLFCRIEKNSVSIFVRSLQVKFVFADLHFSVFCLFWFQLRYVYLCIVSFGLIFYERSGI